MYTIVYNNIQFIVKQLGFEISEDWIRRLAKAITDVVEDETEDTSLDYKVLEILKEKEHLPQFLQLITNLIQLMSIKPDVELTNDP